VVTAFSPNDISGLRMPKNVKFSTKVASSMRMGTHLDFLEKVFFKLWHNLQKSCL